MANPFSEAELSDIETWVDFSGMTIKETQRAIATVRAAWAERDAAREALRALIRVIDMHDGCDAGKYDHSSCLYSVTQAANIASAALEKP